MILISISTVFMIIKLACSHEDYYTPKLFHYEDLYSDIYSIYCNDQNDRYNQQKMDPEEFYSALLSPYFLSIPGFGETYLSASSNYAQMAKLYNELIFKKYTVSTFENEQIYTGNYPKYWNSRPKYFGVSRAISLVNVLYKTNGLIKNEVAYFGDEIKKQLDSKNNNSDIQVPDTQMRSIDEIKSIVKENENYNSSGVPNFYKMSRPIYNFLKALTSFLPRMIETPYKFMERYNETILALLYLNKNVAEYIRKYGKYSLFHGIYLGRVKNLMSPHLLKYESYNLYVMRMKNLDLIPLHLDFFTKKYDILTNWEPKTILEELEVDFQDEN